MEVFTGYMCPWFDQRGSCCEKCTRGTLKLSVKTCHDVFMLPWGL